MAHSDDDAPTHAGWRGFAVIGVVLALSVSALAMPRWQRRIIIGKVVPTATEDALVFAPGTGFACKLLDETKPLAEQSTDEPCPDIHVRAYLKSGDTLLPGPLMTGTRQDGVRASWAEWGAAASGWGPLADRLLPDANGNVKLGVYTTPMEGGCLPKVAVDQPAVDKAGESCLTTHGTLDVPLRKLGEMRVQKAIFALEAEVKRFNETDAGLLLCAQDFNGCAELRALLPVAGCGGADIRPSCTAFVEAIKAQESLRIPAVLDVIASAPQPSDHPNWYALLDILDRAPERLGPSVERARWIVTSEANSRFDEAMKEERPSDAERWVVLAEKYAMEGEGVYHTKPAIAGRRVKYTQMVTRLEAEARAEAARRQAAERPCVAGCLRMVVACDDNPPICGGGCNYSSLCPCCTPAPNDCKSGGLARMAYNYEHPECK